ncbi:MAG: LacI family DNA-binding transcriptional regulator [Verrucomicrobia bacterium]|nr:LacI family DNA-binding transcriptional regulator [Verrucomicrobiota bacterium]MCH8527522.1 LacI family transcriptional regulator [Kiritimatiellia bacterium]
MKKSTNQREIAKAAGVSPAAVSLALRNHPSIPQSTREQIRAVAERLGYQPNPRVAELMGHIRRNRGVEALGESVALYWSDAVQRDVQGYSHLVKLENAVRDTLRANGYGLECFYLDEKTKPARVERMLNARGIRGMILAPLITLPHRHLNWKWENFSVVIAGSGLWRPEFNRVRFHHFAEMGEILHHLHRQGKKRIGLVTDLRVENRSQRAITGGFWARVSPELRKTEAVFESDAENKTAFLNWVNAWKPECLIVSCPTIPDWIREADVNPELILTSMEMAPANSAYAGIRQDYARLGGAAAEQLLAQLLLNQTGVPKDPLKVFITGKWKCAEVSPESRV